MLRRTLLLLLLLITTPASAQPCPGDCDGDGTVTIHEIVRSVQIVLEDGHLERCGAADANGDGHVTVNEVLAAVDAGLSGCDAPTPTPTPIDQPHCGDGSAGDDEECDDGNRADGDGCSAACRLEPGGDPCAGVAAFPGAGLRSELVVDGLDLPVHLTAPPLDPHRLFIVEQRGFVRLFAGGALRPDAFLDLHELVSCCGERGLLSLAFHPDYESNGRFFVNYTNRAGNTVVARYEVGEDPDRADPASARILLTVVQPFENHNGGQLAFGPDGYLYVGMGDGGGGGDPVEAGQDDGTLLGKLLRIDVDVDEPPYRAIPPTNPHAEFGNPLGLTWAKGLRNPWRFTFDRASGDLWIGDVGQNRFEEIDVQPAASPGRENYGWDVFEANTCFEPPAGAACPGTAGFTFPVHAYGRADGCSVTGGFVYRGCALPDLRGEYFYSDYCTAFLRTFELDGGTAIRHRDRTAELAPGGGRAIDSVVSFGEDARGELYVVDYDGEVYRVAPR